MQQARHILKDVFGFDEFRHNQAEVIETMINGGDALILMPTGGGKSLCYQIPALVRGGVGIVVSPLIALMQDQVDALRQLGISAAFLNSSLDARSRRQVEGFTRWCTEPFVCGTGTAAHAPDAEYSGSDGRRPVCHRRGTLRFPVGA